jgi:hypothetical protein
MSRKPNSELTVIRVIDYFEVGSFAICTLYGLIALVRYDQVAAASVKMYPGAGGVIFLAMLTLGGATGLFSYGFHTITGLKLELAGLTLLIPLCIAYAVWTPFSVGIPRGLGLILFMGVLIGIPGFFTRRRLKRYIANLESTQRRH